MYKKLNCYSRLLLVAGALALAGTALAELPPEQYDDFSWEKEIFVTMRDGVRLSTDVLKPEGAKGKLPTVLVRTPYHKENTHWAYMGTWDEFFLKHGYAVVIQNERGRQFSEGYYEDYLEGAATDGYDTLDWISNQSWSNGKVGTFGCSSSGENQWPMANSKHPALAAMLPLASGTAIGDIPGNDTQGTIYRGGIPMLGLWAWWYNDVATSERLLLPPNTTQAQRIRLRNSFTLQPMSRFYQMHGRTIDTSSKTAEHDELMKTLPSMNVIRSVGGALTPFDKYITWMPGDKRWDSVNQARTGHSQIAPALHLNTWHDVGAGEMSRMFKYLQDQGTPDQYLIMGSGPHCDFLEESHLANKEFGDLNVGDARYMGRDNGYAELFLNWFDHKLKGKKNKLKKMPKVQLHVMNKGWITGDKWPFENTQFTKFYLNSSGMAGSRITDGTLSSTKPLVTGTKDNYLYDPSFPVPTRGGSCCSSAMAVDQRDIEARADVLTYSTPVLEKGVTVAGPIEVVLYVSSSAKDTDFIVKLVDVYADGKAINLSNDGFRVRYREGFDKKVLMDRGEVYEIKLTNMVTANYFPAGHRIRLQVSSSNFPAYERNLNTGGNNYDETEWVLAENEVHHGMQYPSHMVLPITKEQSNQGKSPLQAVRHGKTLPLRRAEKNGLPVLPPKQLFKEYNIQQRI